MFLCYAIYNILIIKDNIFISDEILTRKGLTCISNTAQTVKNIDTQKKSSQVTGGRLQEKYNKKQVVAID